MDALIAIAVVVGVLFLGSAFVAIYQKYMRHYDEERISRLEREIRDLQRKNEKLRDIEKGLGSQGSQETNVRNQTDPSGRRGRDIARVARSGDDAGPLLYEQRQKEMQMSPKYPTPERTHYDTGHQGMRMPGEWPGTGFVSGWPGLVSKPAMHTDPRNGQMYGIATEADRERVRKGSEGHGRHSDRRPDLDRRATAVRAQPSRGAEDEFPSQIRSDQNPWLSNPRFGRTAYADFPRTNRRQNIAPSAVSGSRRTRGSQSKARSEVTRLAEDRSDIISAFDTSPLYGGGVSCHDACHPSSGHGSLPTDGHGGSLAQCNPQGDKGAINLRDMPPEEIAVPAEQDDVYDSESEENGSDISRLTDESTSGILGKGAKQNEAEPKDVNVEDAVARNVLCPVDQGARIQDPGSIVSNEEADRSNIVRRNDVW